MSRFNCPCYGVILDGEKVLVLRRPAPHVWEFPGGTMERDETLKETIRREVFEETNLKVDPGLIVPVREANDVVAIFGFCEYQGGKVVISPREHLEHNWVPLASLTKTIGNVPLARSVDAFLKEIKK